jgi:tRNA(fMet)-specific endonuclease VapC
LNEILVDTDVVSYILNRHPLAPVFEKLLIGHTPMISFMTVAELYRGALKKNWGERRIAELETRVRQFAVVPYSLQVCIAYAQICNLAERKGHPVAIGDAFIAACALSLGIPLMTNNRRHFQGIEGLRVVSATTP